ncbi:hypothetical protein KFL_017800010 [Klebsormidium nitens]|uniref:Uncharacterized protein n=1 Tax=Klebsormidium nitens TaxID=105231 RepID=A0A1Y1IS07_KLENI|nr:hypothetical protein KFL_017800010 [Klebsormidium nitens]|eukprot:GAQ93665.1 hypothetical protein KFL_017800010 [Klebsormidium nitens]
MGLSDFLFAIPSATSASTAFRGVIRVGVFSSLLCPMFPFALFSLWRGGATPSKRRDFLFPSLLFCSSSRPSSDLDTFKFPSASDMSESSTSERWWSLTGLRSFPLIRLKRSYSCKPDRREHKPKQKRGGKLSKGVAFSVVEGVAADEWLVDSGSSQHLTGDKSLFDPRDVRGVWPRVHVRGQGNFVGKGKRLG